MIWQTAPELAQRLQDREQMQEQQPGEGMTPEETDKLFAMSQMMNRQPNQQGAVLTKPAAESLIRSMTPAI